MKLTAEQYDALMLKQHRGLMKDYGVAKVNYSREQLTTEEFSAACRELLRDYWTQYFNAVVKQADAEWDESTVRGIQENLVEDGRIDPASTIDSTTYDEG